MANTSAIIIVAICLFAVNVTLGGPLPSVNASPADPHMLLNPSNTGPGRQAGSIAGYLGDDEFMLESEINQRFLATTKYISYAVLNKNSVPCSQRGASYYNCRAGAQANPYSRGCSAITRCR
ncbi:hypothetical protein Dimus_012167 [Dionaea muscipula]